MSIKRLPSSNNRKLALTLIFNYCKKLRRLYYFRKFFTLLKLRFFLDKLQSGVGRIYHKQMNTSLKAIKKDCSQDKKASFDKIAKIFKKKAIYSKA
jgi:hypothetical protein